MALQPNSSSVDLAHVVCAPLNIYAKEYLKINKLMNKWGCSFNIHWHSAGEEMKARRRGEAQPVPGMKSTDVRIEWFCLEHWDQVVGDCCS